jgi:hypothetical protein
MVAIPGGSFQTNSKNEERGNHTSSEKPENSVTTDSFFLSKYPNHPSTVASDGPTGRKLISNFNRALFPR